MLKNRLFYLLYILTVIVKKPVTIYRYSKRKRIIIGNGKFEKYSPKLSLKLENELKNKIVDKIPFTNINHKKYISVYKSVNFSEIRAVILLKPRIHNSNLMIENEFALNLSMSLTEVGIKNKIFWPVSWTPESQSSLRLSVQNEIREFISANKFTHLLIDANMNTKDVTIDADFICQLKSELSVNVVVIMLDYSVTKMSYWGTKTADVFVHSRPDKLKEIEKIESSIICWPGSPYPKFSNLSAIKDLDFFFSGSSTRNRKDFLKYLPSINMKSKINFGERIKNQSFSYHEYIHELSRSRSTFSNGYISKDETMITGRVLEAFSTRTLVFYESSPVMNYFFEPFEHFIPIDTAAELAFSLEYLLYNQKKINQISNSALKYYTEKFSSIKYWSKIFIQ